TLTVNQSSGGSVTFPSGGRGIDQNRDGRIGGSEGVAPAPPRSLLTNRDGILATAGDLIQLVRVIRVGMDVDGDGKVDVDPSRIYYWGGSFGGAYGMAFVALEPDVRAAAFGYVGGAGDWLAPGGRSGAGSIFAARWPSLINGPGVTSLDGVTVTSPYFNDNIPLRSGTPMVVRLQDGTSREICSPVINTVAGVMEIQEWFDRQAWARQAGNPAAYAPHLRKHPLAGMTAKPVLFLFGRGDQSSTNPSNMMILRAGDLADRATFYRNDLAYAENPNVPKNPHGFPGRIGSHVPLMVAIARGAQEQIAVFFESNGTRVIQPAPIRFFEVPIRLPLPEGLNFIPYPVNPTPKASNRSARRNTPGHDGDVGPLP
ncbi:MAG: hypothetical protein HY650_16050, partial [Acidobacteria bacterium]|nr:hypothetical protein [Acidobacteriota bacterium]